MRDLVIIRSDDPDFYTLMRHVLATAGYSTIHVKDCVLETMKVSRIAAILFDSGDRIKDVTAFCRHVKADPATLNVPLLALIKARHEGRYMDLLKAGIDEVLLRPVSPEIVLSWVRACSEAANTTASTRLSPGTVFHFGKLEINARTRAIRCKTSGTHLSPIEFRLLRKLVETPVRVLSRSDLIEAAWPANHHVNSRTVDVHIARLRRKLEETTGRKIIRTIHSSGFVADIMGDKV